MTSRGCKIYLLHNAVSHWRKLSHTACYWRILDAPVSIAHWFLYKQDSDDERKEREKQERIEASIRKRTEEVERSLSSSLRERDKEREQHKKDEAVQLFNALLVDLVSPSHCLIHPIGSRYKSVIKGRGVWQQLIKGLLNDLIKKWFSVFWKYG